MSIKAFLKLVEIQTKVASVFPFIFGLLFAVYRYDVFKPLQLGLFFLSMICIDLATTASNNYKDYKAAKVKAGYNYNVHNAMVAHNLSDRQAVSTIVILIIIGALAGIGLTITTDLVIFAVGFLAFGVGVIYSFGPIPISRTPLGEITSGVVEGGLIPFAVIYSQTFDLGTIIYSLHDWNLHLEVDILELLILALVILPSVVLVANIMLANNICDMEEDWENHRFTLPNYIKKKWSLRLYVALLGIAYLSVIVAVIMDILPIMALVVLLSLIPVIKETKAFMKVQKKELTFVTSVKNFVIFQASLSLGILIALIL